MKAFDKWWEVVNIPHVPTYIDTATASEAWKAALKNVRNIIMFDNNGPSNPKDLMGWLEEELNNED